MARNVMFRVGATYYSMSHPDVRMGVHNYSVSGGMHVAMRSEFGLCYRVARVRTVTLIEQSTKDVVYVDLIEAEDDNGEWYVFFADCEVVDGVLSEPIHSEV